MRTMSFIALFTLCGLLFNCEMYPEASADGVIPRALKRSEIVFVDTGVANHEQLLADLRARHDAHRRFDVHVLDGQRNGIEQISQVLAGYRDIDAIHVVSHGRDGAVQLGNTWLRVDHTEAQARTVARWRDALSRDADVLFYGCNVASSHQGRNFMQAISTLTGADVAASANATGHAALGGDWALESAVGSIETDSVASRALQATWMSVLDVLTFQEGVDSYTGTIDTFVSSFEPDANYSGAVLISTDGNNPIRHGLIRFDNIFGSGPGQIPFGSTITAVDLTVNVAVLSSGTASITLHRMLIPWAETDSWNLMSAGVQADDIEAASVADSVLATPSITGIVTFDDAGLVTTVQAWSDGDPNDGWAVLNDDSINWEFWSSEFITTGLRPVLSVTYTPGITVTNTNDSGVGSLRQAIMDANALGGPATIAFNIPLTDPKHYYYRDDGVSGSLSLPMVTATTLNDASISDFDPDYPFTPHSWYTITPNTALPNIDSDVIIDATTQPGYAGTPVIELDGSFVASNISGLSITGDNSTVRGLVINRFTGHGLVLSGNVSIIENNYIGTDVSGTVALGNGQQGIQIFNSANHTIGGITPGAGNVISGNTWSGVSIQMGGSMDNVIQGNLIGTDATGTVALGNGIYGVDIWNGGPSGNLIGGSTPGAGNVISGNAWECVQIRGVGTTSNTVSGNYIGADASGTLPIPCGLGGIVVEEGAGNNTIGGTIVGAGNLIAFNNGDGVKLKDSSTDSNAIQGNHIFSNSGLGIDLNDDGMSANDISDSDSGANSQQNFPILTSANTDEAGNFYVGGVINSTPSRTFRIEFFSNMGTDPSGHGEGETYLGFTTVTTDVLGHGAYSNVLGFSVSAGSFITATATDQITNDTSEFSAYVTVLNMNQLVVDTMEDFVDAPDTTSITALLADRGLDNLISLREAMSAVNSTPNGTGPDEIHFNIPDTDPNHFYYQDDSTADSLSLVFPTLLDDLSIADFDPDYPGTPHSWYTLSLLSDLPDITEAVIINGYTQPGAAANTLPIGSDAILRIELDGSLAGGGTEGLYINGGGNSTIRGLVINRFGGSGIFVQDVDAHTIEGNYIGTDITGTLDQGNGDDGIKIEDSDNNTIGGGTAASRNVISGNDKHGILIVNTSTGNVVSGNFIGVDATGTVDRGNSEDGIQIQTNGNTVGGAASGSGNVISGNDNDGIHIDGSSATGNMVQGNVIGSDLSGAIATLGNTNNGITIKSSASNNTIGGTAAGEGNLIAFNTIGVAITQNGSDFNQIRGNSIYSNTGLGIDLGSNGPTLNDLDDDDGNENDFLNYPVITSAMTNETDTIIITGTLNSLITTNFDLDFFYTVTEGGEGRVYLSSVSVSTDGSGNASFNNIAFAPFAVPDFAYITATTTVTSGPESGNTSEFSSDFNATSQANTAPVLEPSATPVLNLVDENAGAPVGAVGTLISALIDFPGGGGYDNVTDSDSGAVTGIAVTAADTTRGTWHYTVTSGSTWNPLGAAGINTARLLAADASTRIYFQPNPAYNGTVSDAIQFRAWDQITGVNGGIGDTASPGDPSAFSLAIDSADITVTSVASTPSVTNASTLEDTQTTSGLVISRNIADGPEVTHFKITGISGGTLYHNDGVTVINAGDFITVAQGQVGLKFTPALGSTTPGGFDIESSEDGTTVAAQSGVATATITIITTSGLWLSTDDDVPSPSQAPGLDSWGQDEVLAFDEPNFKLEPGLTDGTLSPVLNLDLFAQDGDADVKGLHYVSQDITIGGNFFPTIDLFAGDLLLIVDSSETLDGTGANLLSVTSHDVFVFRPDASGDYAAGTFLLLLQDPSGEPLNSLSLVENLTLVGDVTLDKGTFIFSHLNKDDDAIYHFDTDDVGVNTSGFVSVLLDGSEFGLDQPVAGLDLVEQSLTVGGTALQAGTLLVTLASDDGAVGTANPMSTQQQDIFYLEVTATSMGSGTSVANATLLLEGNDAGLNTDAEDLDALTLLDTVVNNPPTALSSTVSAVEDTTYTFTVNDFNFSDLDGGSLALLRIKTVETAGDLELSGSDVTAAQVISATDITAGNLKFIPDPDANGSHYATFEFYVHDGIEYSDNSYTMTINVAEQADTPSVTSTTTDEDTQSSTGLVLALSAVDGEGVNYFKITAISGGVLYQNDGVTTIRSGDFISFAEGNAGLKFTPAVNSVANGSFAVQASTANHDSGLGGNSVTATITVTPVGDTPQAASIVTLEDTPSGPIVLDRNMYDGPEVTHFRITNITGGVLMHADGVTVVHEGDFITFSQGHAGLRFTPLPDSNAVGSFDVESSDDGLTVASQSGIATATISVTPVNDGPSSTIALASYAASENTLLTLHGTGLSVGDPDAGASLVRVTLSVGEGSLTVTAGSTGVTVSGSGSASVTVEGTLAEINDVLAGHLGATIIYDASVATDTVLTLHIDDLGASGVGGLLTATDTATLTIAATAAGNNSPMAIRVSHNAIDENTDTRSGYRIGILTTTDPDIADAFAYTIVGGADAAKFSIGGAAANELILTDGTLDHETTSSYEVTVRVIDSGGLTHDETLTITVTDLATVIAAGQSFSVSETAADGALIGTVGTTGDTPVTFAITGGNVNNAFAIDPSGTITVADSSALDFDTTSSYTLTVEVSDGTTSVSETVTITITDVAETPSSDGAGSISSPPSTGEVALSPNTPPDVNPEGDAPEPESEDSSISDPTPSEDSSISTPTPSEDGSPEPQAPNPQVGNSRTPNPQTLSPPASAPRPTRLGTDNNGFIPGQNSVPSRNSERLDTPAPTATTSVNQTDTETNPIVAPLETDDLHPLMVAEGLLQALDEMRDEIRKDVAFSHVAIGSTLTFVTGLSIGYVLWLIRGGLLLSSLLSSLPAWRFVDPLPVLAHWGASAKEDATEDDSLEAVLQKGADVANSRPESTSRMNVDKGGNQPEGPRCT